MIKFINNDHQVIKMIREEQIQSLHHTQILTDENYVSEHLSIQMTHLEDEIIKDAEFVAIPVTGHEFMHHFFWIKDYMYDNDVLNIQGVQAIIEMLRKSPIIDYRPQNTTLRAAVEQALNGTGVTARYVGNFGSNSSNAYFTSVWDALKKYCLTWNAEMQCFVEITDMGVGALFIDFRSKIGVNNGARVVYGHNALEIVKEEERAEIYTALIGRGNAEEVGETEDGDATYGRKINFKDISWSISNGDPVNKPLGQYYVELPAATSQYGINQGGVMKPKVGFVDIDTDDPEEVLSRTYTILQEVSRPKALFRTTSAYLNAEIGDEVRVVRPDKDIDYSTRVFEITWDRLNNTAVSVKLGDRIIESQSSRERRITNSASVRAIEEVNRVIEGSVNYIVSANGLNRNYYGSIDPRDDGHTPFINDIWYRPDPDSDGDTILYIWNGTIWEEVTRTFNNEKVAKIMEDVQEIVNEIDLDFEVTIQEVKRVLDDAGKVDLDHIFARLITDGRFGTMFMQNAKTIGLVYEENGETESIIGIIDGTPYIKGANIILNGDTKVDGTFAVTKEMISPEVIVDRLIAHELIDASDINVINLNANSISGGNLELANGLKITNNGHAVLSVDSSGRMIFDATGAGVATKEELKNIELTPGPQGVPGKDGKDGVATYTWIRYADNANGAGISNSPTGKTYIGFAYNKTTPTESNNASDYVWSKIVGPQGNQGVRGADGADGQTTYTWIKYAPNATGLNMTDTPQSNTTHIGIAVNKLTQAESNDRNDYTWSLFKGDKGDTGERGIQGPKGADGTSQYVHIRYSRLASGSGMTVNPQSNTMYIGLANTSSATAPTSYTAYTWSKYRGEDGDQGIQGPPGPNGQPTYTWVKYANTPTSGMSDSPEGKKYIGLAFNKTTPTESSSYAQYTWSLMPQNIALGVRNLVPWTDFTDYRDNISKWSRWGAGTIWQARQSGKYMLFRNSNTDRTGSGTAGVISPPFYKNVEAGRTYAIRFLAVTSNHINAPFNYCYLMNVDNVEKMYGGNGNQSLPTPTKIPNYESASGLANDADLYEFTFTSLFTGPASIMLASSIDLSQLSSHWITEPMIVEGDSISRDWSPAPEDIDRLIKDNIDENVGNINAELSEHWEAIGDKVAVNAFTEAMNSMKRDYEQGLLEASKVPEEVQSIIDRNWAVTSNLGDKVEEWNFLNTHVRLGDEGLYIGDMDGSSSLLIGTDRISFMQGQEEVAYISGQQMFINRTIVVESMQIGSHAHQRIDNNSTIIVWVGG